MGRFVAVVMAIVAMPWVAVRGQRAEGVPQGLKPAFAAAAGATARSLACLEAFQREKADALSQAEIEQLRETNRMPNERVLVFVKFLDERATTIQNLVAKPRRPGREEDIHDAMEQFISIADSLEDNLNEYGPRHRDIRKALPKLLRAIDRWTSIIKSPAGDEAYNVSRKLSLESIRDLREDTEHLIDDQKTWFAAHPPQKDAEGNVIEQ